MQRWSKAASCVSVLALIRFSILVGSVDRPIQTSRNHPIAVELVASCDFRHIVLLYVRLFLAVADALRPAIGARPHVRVVEPLPGFVVDRV